MNARKALPFVVYALLVTLPVGCGDDDDDAQGNGGNAGRSNAAGGKASGGGGSGTGGAKASGGAGTSKGGSANGGSGQGGGSLRVKRELEGGWFQYLTMPLPALLTIQSGINQLRYATLKGIMAAKKKEIAKVAAPAGAVTSRQKIVALYAPQKAKQTVMIGGSPAEAAKELVKRLREEARVL